MKCPCCNKGELVKGSTTSACSADFVNCSVCGFSVHKSFLADPISAAKRVQEYKDSLTKKIAAGQVAQQRLESIDTFQIEE
ncbi:MAG: hypothetical protein WCW02_00250 [Candidatus Buchananbacteria bacterium]